MDLNNINVIAHVGPPSLNEILEGNVNIDESDVESVGLDEVMADIIISRDANLDPRSHEVMAPPESKDDTLQVSAGQISQPAAAVAVTPPTPALPQLTGQQLSKQPLGEQNNYKKNCLAPITQSIILQIADESDIPLEDLNFSVDLLNPRIEPLTHELGLPLGDPGPGVPPSIPAELEGIMNIEELDVESFGLDDAMTDIPLVSDADLEPMSHQGMTTPETADDAPHLSAEEIPEPPADIPPIRVKRIRKRADCVQFRAEQGPSRVNVLLADCEQAIHNHSSAFSSDDAHITLYAGDVLVETTDKEHQIIPTLPAQDPNLSNSADVGSSGKQKSPKSLTRNPITGRFVSPTDPDKPRVGKHKKKGKTRDERTKPYKLGSDKIVQPQPSPSTDPSAPRKTRKRKRYDSIENRRKSLRLDSLTLKFQNMSKSDESPPN